MIRKMAMSIVTLFRKTRSTIATYVLRKRAKSCGRPVGAARMPDIGSVVLKDVPRCAIVGGNPAKVIKYRDIEHFEKLKVDNRF